jgi:hypothetical protein
MKIISILTFSCALALATVACVESTSSTDQAVCTVEDEEAGNCPPGGMTIAQWTQQRQTAAADAQMPGQTPAEKGSSCSNGVCTAEWRWNTGWGQIKLLTSCNSCTCNTDMCWADEPCMHVAPGPGCTR